MVTRAPRIWAHAFRVAGERLIDIRIACVHGTSKINCASCSIGCGTTSAASAHNCVGNPAAPPSQRPCPRRVCLSRVWVAGAAAPAKTGAESTARRPGPDAWSARNEVVFLFPRSARYPVRLPNSRCQPEIYRAGSYRWACSHWPSPPGSCPGAITLSWYSGCGGSAATGARRSDGLHCSGATAYPARQVQLSV